MSIKEMAQPFLEIKNKTTKLENYIGGEFLPPISGTYIENINPATGECYSLVPDSDERDIDLATKSAQEAFVEWSQLETEKREKLLLKVADRIEEKKEELAYAESVDNGKPIKLARNVDIPRAAMNFRFFASAMRHFSSEAHPMGKEAINYTLKEPLGVVGTISPWNLPLYLLTWKIAPALATGNTVVAKPSEITPMTAYLLAKICDDVGVPKGVLNIVQGEGGKAGAAITSHKDISAISFTGGTETGKIIAKTAAPLFKKHSLELGGKNSTIVFADCDYENTLEQTLRAAFANQGQICLCGSRIFVEKAIYERFRDDLVKKTKALRVGDPLLEESDQGALVSFQHKSKVLKSIKQAIEEGGKILCGGEEARLEGRCEKGYFVYPTLIENLAPNATTNQEEIFGPVATIIPFEKEEEVVSYANHTQYGLASSIWTKDLSRAHRVAGNIKTGIVWINSWMLRDLRTPFGGIKSSGVGREGGIEALRFFTEMKNVCVKIYTH